MEFVLEQMSKRLSIPAHELELFLSETRLQLSEELSDRNISVASILEIRKVVTLSSNNNGSSSDLQISSETVKDDGKIALKCQTKDRKSTLILRLGMQEKMAVLMKKYSDEKKIPLKKLKFMFDGEELGRNETPETLDLEGDECIDIY